MKKYFLLMLIMLAGITSCKKGENTAQVDNGLNIKTYVTSEAGLVLRSAPDISGQELAMVPYKEELVIIKYSDRDTKVGKAMAPWAFVRFKNLEGWVFAGSLGGIQKGNYKNHDLKLLINDVSIKYKNTIKLSSGEGEVTTNTPDQIKVLEINGNLAIIEYMCDGCLEYNPETAQALWYFKDGKWNDLEVVKKLELEACPSTIRIRLLYVNNDEYIDVACEGEISDNPRAMVYLNDGTNLNATDFPKDTGTGFESNGPCGSSVIRIINYDMGADENSFPRFNCRTNKFE